MVVQPGQTRDLDDEYYTCTFCGEQVRRGAIWAGPDISICDPCITSNHAADMIGRIFGDALFSIYNDRAYVDEIERVTTQIKSSIFQSLYCQTRLRTERKGSKGNAVAV